MHPAHSALEPPAAALTHCLAACHDCREVLTLAGALSRLAVALPARQLSRSPTVNDFRDAVHLQSLAASWGLAHCTLLGIKLNLSGSQALRVANAAQLVLQAAPWSLAVGRAGIEQHGPQEAVRLGLAGQLAECCDVFGAAVATAAELVQRTATQDVVAAWAGSAARPSALLPFLREMALTLLSLPAEFSDNPRKLMRRHLLGVAWHFMAWHGAGGQLSVLSSASLELLPVRPGFLCNPSRCACRRGAPCTPGAGLLLQHHKLAGAPNAVGPCRRRPG